MSKAGGDVERRGWIVQLCSHGGELWALDGYGQPYTLDSLGRTWRPRSMVKAASLEERPRPADLARGELQ